MTKKVQLILALTLVSAVAMAQEPTISLTQTQNPTARYRLFPTINMYTFLKLDTQTGAITRIQWGFNDAHRFEIRLCGGCNQTTEAPKAGPGRFTLYPTQNFYTFVLLDQVTGAAWQVVWSGPSEGMVAPIDKIPSADLKAGE